MAKILKVPCSCGQENQLVETEDGRLRYDITRHGNGELCEGRCFNCRAILKLKPESETTTKTEPIPESKSEPESKPEPSPEPTPAPKPAEESVKKPQGKKKKK